MTIEEAKEVIKKYKSEDDYIVANIKRFMNFLGDPDDNSIELAIYYQKCKIRAKDKP